MHNPFATPEPLAAAARSVETWLDLYPQAADPWAGPNGLPGNPAPASVSVDPFAVTR